MPLNILKKKYDIEPKKNTQQNNIKETQNDHIMMDSHI